MKIAIGIYYYLIIWVSAIAKEVISRLLSIVFFPIALMLHDRIIKHLYGIDEALVKERTWKDTRELSVDKFYKKVNKAYFFLWMFLDDSTAKDSYDPYGGRMYSASDNPERYPEWIWNLQWTWLLQVWWAFIRNNTVNYVSWNRTGGWKTPYETTTYWGKFDIHVDKNDKNSQYYPGMYLSVIKHRDGKYYPFFTYIGTIFVRKFGIWQGKSEGSGRFSFSVRA